MLRTRAPEVRLWEAVLPDQVLRLPEELARVDALLDDPVFFAPFVPFFDPRVGRPSTPMEVYLRMMFLKFRYRLGYDSLCREVADSITWRRFCRIPLDGRVPHPTTLMKLTTRCGTAAVDGCNEALLAKAAEAKLLRTARLRADTTVVPADVAYPTDSGLLAKAVRRIGRGRAADPGCRGCVADPGARPRPLGRDEGPGDRGEAAAARRRPATRPRPRCAGQVNDRARRSGQIRPESRHGAATKPGGPPPGSTATTLTDQPAEDRSTPDPCGGPARGQATPGAADAAAALDAAAGCCCAAYAARILRRCRSPKISIRSVSSVRTVNTTRSGEAVRPRTARRNLDYLDVRIRQHRVERRRELTGPIPDEEPEPGNTLAEVHHEVAGLLGRPRPVRCPVTPRTCR